MSPREPRHLSWWPNLPALWVQLRCPECTCCRGNTGRGTARGVHLPSMGPPEGAQIWVRQPEPRICPFLLLLMRLLPGRPTSDFLVTKWGQGLSLGASRGLTVQPRVPPADQALPLFGFFGNRCLLSKCSASFLSVISSAGLVQPALEELDHNAHPSRAAHCPCAWCGIAAKHSASSLLPPSHITPSSMIKDRSVFLQLCSSSPCCGCRPCPSQWLWDRATDTGAGQAAGASVWPPLDPRDDTGPPDKPGKPPLVKIPT